MAPLTRFAPPAGVKDLSGDEQTSLEAQWSGNLNRWTETAILGDPWDSLHDRDRTHYYNPLETDIGAGAVSKAIHWTAFPNRILAQFPNATFLEQMGYAEGVHEDGTFGPPPDVNGQPYRPGGPRGWQDEYCEWISVRDQDGNITSIDFTCENPEYWFSLWRVDPSRVLALYRQLVGPNVQMADLYLLGQDGQPVIDRATGLPTYDPKNQWNSAPSQNGVTGAVHLISPPNTLGAEIYLAAAATLLREEGGQPVTDPDALIHCSQYGQPGRNSDPTIGAEVNNIITTGGLIVSLQDPIGLYLQTPDFSGYLLPFDPNLPPDAEVSECWQILRGRARGPNDAVDFILHARFTIPERWRQAGVSFTVSDIQINGNPIRYGAQLTQTFQVALSGLALPTTMPDPARQPCTALNPRSIPTPRAVQDLDLLLAGTTSNAVTLVEQGSSVPNIALFAVNTTAQTTIQFEGAPGVVATVTDFRSFPQGELFTLTIDVDPTAPLGDRSLLLTNPDGSGGPPAPGQLSIVPPGTLGLQAAAPPAAMAEAFALADRGEGAAAAPAEAAMTAAVARKMAHIEEAQRGP